MRSEVAGSVRHSVLQLTKQVGHENALSTSSVCRNQQQRPETKPRTLEALISNC